MIELNYTLDPDYRRETEAFDLPSATDTDLDFYVYCGDFYFRVGAANFDAPWNWVTILGMARQLFESAEIAARGETPPPSKFSESQDEIYFSPKPGGLVEVSANYSSDRATVPSDELLDATHKFLARVCDDFAMQYPRVLESAAFNAIRQLVANSNRGRS